METTATLATEKDILRLVNAIENDWTLAMFMSKHKRAKEAEVMIAQTLHACKLNLSKGRGLFSFKGDGLQQRSGWGLIDNPTAYATLLRIGYFIEDVYEGRSIIRPTQTLVDALDSFLKVSAPMTRTV